MLGRREVQQAQTALDNATDRHSFQSAAQRLDRLTGAQQWRNDNRSDLYDHELLASHLQKLRSARQDGQGEQLATVLSETLQQHYSLMHEAKLWEGAVGGGKRLVTAWLEQVEASLRWLVTHNSNRFTWDRKLDALERASLDWGRSALMLSGGAGLGFLHLGVVQALLEAKLLPSVISGSSMGAAVAATACTRNDEELTALFQNPLSIDLSGLRNQPLRSVLDTGSIFDEGRWSEALRCNIGEMTFREAFAHSGRALSVVVAALGGPSRVRVLNHITAPDVVIWTAVRASCAIPGLFAPSSLLSREPGQVERPWRSNERFIDGSFWGDLPLQQLRRLFGVNHSIVSQANPLVLPWVAMRQGSGAIATSFDVAGALVWGSSRGLAGLAGRRVPNASLRRAIADVWGIIDQTREGDI
ncbi:MAG TPA: hypothetical protein DCQ06_00325, partial [Myxococcales bacterium]|nr:hypothetical protein [Myxococcales bacterium]